MATNDSPRAADRFRQAIVCVGAAIAVLGSLFGSGAFGGEPMPEVAGGVFNQDATLLAPAGPAFTIWSLIYAGLVGYAIWQALPGQATVERHRALGYWMLASMLLNALWLVVVQLAWLVLSVGVIVALLAVLAVSFVRLRRRPGAGAVGAVLLDGTVGLYLGWVMVATVANVTAVLVALGFQGLGASPELWAIGVLVVTGALVVAVIAWGRGRLAPAAASAWGIAWIGVARSTGELSSQPVATTAFTIALIIVVAVVTVRLAAHRRELVVPAGQGEAESA